MSIGPGGSRVLVTGGAGFIGSFIVDQMIEAGADHVTIVDDFVRGRHENLVDAVGTGRVEVVEGDIRDAALVDRLTDGCDLVFHQAALRVTQSAEEPLRAIQVMVNGTQNVLEAARKYGVKKIAAASTASVYGDPSYLPMDELHPFNNRTLYGAAKIANEQILRAYNEMYGLEYVMFRPFNVYGPRMDVFGAYTEVMIRWLERLGIAPTTFAIPLGQSNNWSAANTAAAREAGYTTIYAQAEETRPAGTVARTFVTCWDGDRVFKAALGGAFDRWEEWV